jgi:hypothetical protein
MRAFAAGITMVESSSGTRRVLERLAEPVYRFDDPARQNLDGTVWAWGRSGRPAALLTFAKTRAPDGSFRWLGELTSLGASSKRSKTSDFGEGSPM